MLVPLLGITGAAIATLVGYCLLYVAFVLVARRYLHVRFPWGTLLRAGLAALVMYAALHFILPGRRFVASARAAPPACCSTSG